VFFPHIQTVLHFSKQLFTYHLVAILSCMLLPTHKNIFYFLSIHS